jgi:uncharacterized protein YdbL (DUF1318 family)
MKKNTLDLLLMIAAIFAFTFATSALAQGVKDRFKERLPLIVELKSEGVIGENNEGYLEFVGNVKKREDVVRSENADRRLVYEKIAESENTTVEKVGRRRALQLRELAKPGDWLQGDDGEWMRK